MAVMLEDIAAQIRSGRVDEAEKRLAGVSESDDNRGDVLFLKGYLREQQHDAVGALKIYDQVLALAPDHVEALFRSGMLLDRLGDDDEAVERLESAASGERVPVQLMLNLAIVYEESGRLEDAESCVEAVLREHPNHVRARNLKRSIDSSQTMVFDERTHRDREKRNAVLDVPITDFELSVRSRNCLKQMNIRTLGDLLRTTEEELLGYKNFGETSLNEIKAMLTAKNLRLGQSLAESRTAVAALEPEALPPTENVAALQKSVGDLELSVRSRKCLQRLGISSLAELANCTEAQLMAIKNFGVTSLAEIKRQLAANGLSLRGPR
jgi:DNA-directed RNA polymerase subunit alpha